MAKFELDDYKQSGIAQRLNRSDMLDGFCFMLTMKWVVTCFCQNLKAPVAFNVHPDYDKVKKNHAIKAFHEVVTSDAICMQLMDDHKEYMRRLRTEQFPIGNIREPVFANFTNSVRANYIDVYEKSIAPNYFLVEEYLRKMDTQRRCKLLFCVADALPRDSYDILCPKGSGLLIHMQYTNQNKNSAAHAIAIFHYIDKWFAVYDPNIGISVCDVAKVDLGLQAYMTNTVNFIIQGYRIT